MLQRMYRTGSGQFIPGGEVGFELYELGNMPMPGTVLTTTLKVPGILDTGLVGQCPNRDHCR
jgi:hypothetical protein